MQTRYLKYLAALTVVIVLGWGILRLFNKPMRYEIPGGFKGWFVVQFENQTCPPLHSQGMFLVVSVPASGKVCTSTPFPHGWVYYRFEYVFPDGTRERLRWNRHGKPGTQVWVVGWDMETKTEENLWEMKMQTGEVRPGRIKNQIQIAASNLSLGEKSALVC